MRRWLLLSHAPLSAASARADTFPVTSTNDTGEGRGIVFAQIDRPSGPSTPRRSSPSSPVLSSDLTQHGVTLGVQLAC